MKECDTKIYCSTFARRGEKKTRLLWNSKRTGATRWLLAKGGSFGHLSTYICQDPPHGAQHSPSESRDPVGREELAEARHGGQIKGLGGTEVPLLLR